MHGVIFAAVLSLARLDSEGRAFVQSIHANVTLIFGAPTTDENAMPFVRAGLARIRRSVHGCFAEWVFDPSPTLVSIAHERGWPVDENSITIPVGRYQYVEHSAWIDARYPNALRGHFTSKLVPNRNVKTLAFLAPIAAWELDADRVHTQPGGALADAIRGVQTDVLLNSQGLAIAYSSGTSNC